MSRRKRKAKPQPQPQQAPATERVRTVVVRARYDAAQTDGFNSKYYAAADALSARQANNLAVRKKIRERARYERDNNPYLQGICQTLANTLVGAGPRLRINTPDKQLNSEIERHWTAWAKAIRLPDQLRVMKQAKTIDGEAFGVLKANPRLLNPAQLDLVTVEADQFSSPYFSGTVDDQEVDGIRFDAFGNPETYTVLRSHPGDLLGTMGEADILPASQVLHWFRCDRPGQARGISEVVSALPLFMWLRRFGLATVTAAETAANFAAVLKSNYPAEADDEEGDPWKTVEIVRGMMSVLPNQTEMQQFAAEHPTTNHEMFVNVILREIARCLCMPFIMASLDSSKSNFSSARLDILIFRSAISVERQDCERECLLPLFFAWLAEAKFLPNVLLPYRPTIEQIGLAMPVEWVWPAWEYIDPLTEAQADTERLTNGTTSLGEICAERGKDWREVIRQQLTEKQYRAQLERELGVAPQPEPQPTPPPEPDARIDTLQATLLRLEERLEESERRTVEAIAAAQQNFQVHAAIAANKPEPQPPVPPAPRVKSRRVNVEKRDEESGLLREFSEVFEYEHAQP